MNIFTYCCICENILSVRYLLSHVVIVNACNNEAELPMNIAGDDQSIAYLDQYMRRKGVDDQQPRNYEHQLLIKDAQDPLNHYENVCRSLADVICSYKNRYYNFTYCNSKRIFRCCRIDLFIHSN